MARGSRPTPRGFNHGLLDRRVTELGLRSVDAVAAGLHWGYVTSLRRGDLECPGAKMLPDLAAFVKVLPRDLYAITEEEVTVCHLRHFRGWSMNDAAAERGWTYAAYKGFEAGEPLPKDMSTAGAWSKTARVFGVSTEEMRRAWETSHRLSSAPASL
ncbi:hypothetical protein [Streptomyces violaceusniger]|uniref:Uncharacterized protein n=1 Tax=Streptomyces violaceusniger (strain Tu 4113) TaxID=653045 RepID=G2PHY0_STRV4|nr:hypothetical protein [Streptomyces violaceusniger]AEM88931.1 hypothetical protein Strvi_0156 [Streptomyces violaceusniger Tu 4113]